MAATELCLLRVETNGATPALHVAQGPIGVYLDVSPVTMADLADMVEIEKESFSHDEATPASVFEDRIRRCPSLFLVARDSVTKRVVAFCSASRSAESRITESTLETHDEHGSRLCIHSVAVRSSLRGKGIGPWLFAAFMAIRVARLKNIHEVALIAHDKVIKLYEKHGFQMIGPALVELGNRQWYEMALTLRKPVAA